MNHLKLLLKIILGIIGILILCIFIMLSGESYEIESRNHSNKMVNLEIKRFFWKKISECSIDSSGFYHGPASTWHLFTKTLRNEGEYKEGFWNGRWNEYDRNGQLTMVREWNMGKLDRLFLPMGSELKEIPKENWPKYANVNQTNPQRIKE